MYRNLSDSPLLDYFILCRGVRNVLVLVFRFYECSLIDLVHYRHLLHSPWTDQEIVSIALILLRQYKQLWLCGIAHRDIRLGKIYYTPQPADNTLDTTFSLLLNLEAGCRVPY